MRIARFEVDGEPVEGTVAGEEIETDEGTYAVDEVDLLPPSNPSKIIGVGMNYRDHIIEMAERKDREPTFPEIPYYFFKPPSSLIGHEDRITYPAGAGRIDYEGELGVVIGEQCRDVDADSALEYVKGYTCINDVSWRDWLDREPQWVRHKGTDTFCPAGPFLQTDVDGDRSIETRLNGEVVQSSNTAEMIFPVAELVAECSNFMTLLDGDIIATGTPAGVDSVEPGDVVEVEVESVGTLRNPVSQPP